MNAPVTAIVLNWCNEADTAACIESLAASGYGSLTILLVDNGSPDGSGERLQGRFPHVAYLQTGANLGYAGGNNRGIAWALERAADYVLIVNDDTVMDAHCVASLANAAMETGAAAVAPRIVYFDDPGTLWYAGGDFSRMRAIGRHRHENAPDRGPRARAPITFACGCCFLIRADVVRQCGGFDESYFAYMEDVELSLRLTTAGHALLYEPAARVLHRIKRAAPPTPFQIRQRDRNRRRLVARHYGLSDRLRFALWFYPTRLVLVLKYLLSANFSCAAAVVQGAIGPLRAHAIAPVGDRTAASDSDRADLPLGSRFGNR